MTITLILKHWNLKKKYYTSSNEYNSINLSLIKEGLMGFFLSNWVVKIKTIKISI